MQNRLKAYFRNNFQSGVLVFWLSLTWNYSFKNPCASLLTSSCGISHQSSCATNKHCASVFTQQCPKRTSRVAETKFHLKKRIKFCSHRKVLILMKLNSLQSSKIQTYHSTDQHGVCLVFKREKGSGQTQVWVWEKRSSPNKWGQQKQREESEFPSIPDISGILYILHSALHSYIFQCSTTGSCISVVSYCTKSFV